MSETTQGSAFGLSTALIWGAMFVIAKSALGRVDAFHLTAIRYLVASAILLAVLAAVEGRDALRLDGYGLRLLGLGTLGFAGFNLLGFTGLAHTRAESASLVVALAPLLTALVLWQRTKVRPSAATFGFLAVALTGVFLVLSNGHPGRIVGGSVGWGVGLVVLGVLSFVVYGLGAARLPGFSPLRYTALTAALGWLSLLAATTIALGSGLVATPSAHQLQDVTPQLAYLALPGAFVAVLTWNAAIRLIGPQNAVLFGNLIPVTTFAVEIARGYRPGAVEVGGAALTIAALVASNLHTRAATRSSREHVPREEVPESAELLEAA